MWAHKYMYKQLCMHTYQSRLFLQCQKPLLSFSNFPILKDNKERKCQMQDPHRKTDPNRNAKRQSRFSHLHPYSVLVSMQIWPRQSAHDYSCVWDMQNMASSVLASFCSMMYQGQISFSLAFDDWAIKLQTTSISWLYSTHSLPQSINIHTNTCVLYLTHVHVHAPPSLTEIAQTGISKSVFGIVPY